LYRTTSEFLEAFGLRSLEELPPIDIDAAAPIELALPIATRAVQPGAEANRDDLSASVPANGAEEDAAGEEGDESGPG
jgi:hypothetical protein